MTKIRVILQEAQPTNGVSSAHPGLVPHRYHVNLRMFDGKSSPVRWWTSFIAFITLQRMTKREAIICLPFHLMEMPAKWFAALPDEYKISLATLKQAFIDRFQLLISANVSLTDLRKGPTEPVTDYIHRATQYNKDKSVTEDFLVTLTLRGMQKEIDHIVMPQLPKTMEELRRQGAIAEMTISVTNPTDGGLNAAIVQNVEKVVASAETRLMADISERFTASVSAIQDTFQQKVDQEIHEEPARRQPMFQPARRQPIFQPARPQPMLQPARRQPIFQPARPQPMLQPATQQQRMFQNDGQQVGNQRLVQQEYDGRNGQYLQ